MVSNRAALEKDVRMMGIKGAVGILYSHTLKTSRQPDGGENGERAMTNWKQNRKTHDR